MDRRDRINQFVDRRLIVGDGTGGMPSPGLLNPLINMIRCGILKEESGPGSRNSRS